VHRRSPHYALKPLCPKNFLESRVKLKFALLFSNLLELSFANSGRSVTRGCRRKGASAHSQPHTPWTGGSAPCPRR
jgi:hypothetical protein